ncbi:MAG: helix-turn-helix transcriptional regulator [Clostridia bacterium]|nr:helix-turn-helix transcriptional regulator [Clostridia bacterium]
MGTILTEYEEKHRRYSSNLEVLCGLLTYPNARSTIVKNGRVRCFHAHIHEAVEVLLVEQSVMHVRTADRTFDAYPGDLVIFEPFELHECWADVGGQPLIYWVLVFEPRFFQAGISCTFGESLSRLMNSELHLDPRMAADHPAAERAGELIRQVNQVWMKKDSKTVGDEGRIIGGIYELMGLLFDEQCHDGGKTTPGRSVGFITDVMRYIRENYDSPVSTEDICAAMSYNKSHFCHRFRANFGCSYIDFLNQYRVLRATRDYRNCQQPISEIAASVGFSDCCYFTRVFKRCMGVTPSQYFMTK